MLSLTIFAAAASAAAQPAPATTAPPQVPPLAGLQEEDAASQGRADVYRAPTVWRFIEPGVDGGQVWL